VTTLPPALPPDLPRERLIGITTTVPTEVLLAADRVPVDLNNLFVTHPEPTRLVRTAEEHGFPRTCCCWTRGLYGAVREYGIPRVLGVARGDCSNAEALLEVLSHEGTETIAFDYPRQQDQAAMQAALEELAEATGADLERAEDWRRRLDRVRELARRIDALSWQEDRVHGLENHLWLVSTSDFCAAPEAYEQAARQFLDEAAAREPIPHRVRLGLCGIPPIVPELYDFIEHHGGLVVYNETSRQFSLPNEARSLAEAYTRYTYPYGVRPRLADIQQQRKQRRLDGLVHYVQSFCHRRIQDPIVRSEVGVPVLTIEADAPGPLSGQLKTRLEAFVQMLAARKAGKLL
jgi:benzoyl-CoA reductase/2-hydroxyglutaryl-CoA dehydratase subunit BcrC/BadD/HgdB